MEDKIKHLEVAHGIINRMGQTSFIIKGWTVTLISALFALAAKDTNQKFILVAYFPTIIFWLLDSYFLYQERLFRKVYTHISKQTVIDFSLATKDFDEGLSDWASVAFSKTILLFYGCIIATLLTVMFIIN